jgi:Recombination endonuclease VII/HNH endonuclease
MVANPAAMEIVMPRQSADMPFTLAELSRVLHYDQTTGKFTWIADIAKVIKKGEEAGNLKRTRLTSGEVKSYRFITYKGWSVPASRIAWLFIHGDWPQSNVIFVDGDSSNLRADNLKLGTSSVVVIDDDGQRRRVMTPEKVREYSIQRYQGVDYSDYLEMIAAQGNRCAICGERESATVGGKIKELSVDHDHETGAVRALLCASCNHLLGHCREDVTILRAAADYIERHRTAKVVPFPKEGA